MIKGITYSTLISLRKAVHITALLLLISVANILPFTFKSCVMTHPQSKKKVILFDEGHASYLKKIANYSQRRMISKIYNHQKAIFTALGHALVNLDPAAGGQYIVITETDDNSFGCLAEEEMGAIGARDTAETMHVLPRIFLHRLFVPASTINARGELLKAAIKPFNAIPAVSFVLDNNVRWIVGDRFRTQQDAYLAFEVYQNWKKIVAAVEAQENLAKEQEEVTIGYVKEYIDTWHAVFEKHGIVDSYHKKISDVIAAALATGDIQEADHLALLHKYLVEGDKKALRDEFNNAIIAFISQKFDVELRTYLNEFNNDQALTDAFVIAGGAHNEQLREFLVAQGYIMVEQAGIDINDTKALFQDKTKTKLTDLLQAIKKNSPFVNMQELLGVNVNEIPEPYDWFYAKQMLKAASSLLVGGLGAMYLWQHQYKKCALASMLMGTLLAAAAIPQVACYLPVD